MEDVQSVILNQILLQKGDKKENGEDTEVHPVHENYIQAILNMIRTAGNRIVRRSVADAKQQGWV